MKLTHSYVWALFLATGLATGCFRQEIQTLVVKVPQMTSAECAKPILKALQGPIDGIVSATPDYEKRTVSVTYDTTKLAIKNIEFVIAGVGFDANDIPAKPEARKALPAECR